MRNLRKKGKLDQSILFKGLYQDLVARYGSLKASSIWEEAENRLEVLEESHKENMDRNDRMMVFPTISLYQAIECFAQGDALQIMRMHGTKMGLWMKGIFEKVTALPGFPSLMWKKMPWIAKKMSEGYQTEDVEVSAHRCSLHVVECPLYTRAQELGEPKAAQFICCMDKEYMTGFRGVKYTRTKSLAEGDPYCDYLLEDERK